MDKVIFLSIYKINGFGGASIGQKKIFYALKDFCIRENLELISITLENDSITKYGIKPVVKYRIYDYLSRILLHSTYFYIWWIFNKRKVLELNPKIVVLGNSKMGFVAKYFKSKHKEIRVIGHFDNFELQCVDSYYADKKDFLTKIKKNIDKYVVARDERSFTKSVDVSIFLTSRDENRVLNQYPTKAPSFLWPVMVEHSPIVKLPFKKQIMFTGSLSYGSNLDGLFWFIENVWIDLSNDKFDFIIAGANPTEELKRVCSKHESIRLISNFANLNDIITVGSIMVSPILNGSGMKVKVAESLSHGLPIIGTTETFIGYEKHIDGKFIVRSDSSKDFIYEIRRLMVLSDDEFLSASVHLKEIHSENFSYIKSNQILQSIMDKVMNERYDR